MWDNRLAISLSLFSLFYKVYAHGVKSSITAIDDHDNDTEHWNLSEKPNLNDTTSNFIFETASFSTGQIHGTVIVRSSRQNTVISLLLVITPP